MLEGSQKSADLGLGLELICQYRSQDLFLQGKVVNLVVFGCVFVDMFQYLLEDRCPLKVLSAK